LGLRPTRRAALTALALALGARAPARAATPAPVRGLALKVGLVPGAETAQPFYAREQGAFGRAGLDVDIRLFTDASAVGAALVAGAIDVAYGGIIAAAVAHDKDPPIVVLAGANVYVARAAATGILVVARASPIRSAADLTGKTVAVPAADEAKWDVTKLLRPFGVADNQSQGTAGEGSKP